MTFLSADLMLPLLPDLRGTTVEGDDHPVRDYDTRALARSETSFLLSGCEVDTALFVPLPLLALLSHGFALSLHCQMERPWRRVPDIIFSQTASARSADQRLSRPRWERTLAFGGFLAVLAVAAG